MLTSENFGQENLSQPEITAVPEWIDLNFKDFSDVRLGYIGEKEMGGKLKEKALLYKYQNLDILDINDKIGEDNIEHILDKNDFIIVDLNSWNPYYTDFINKKALEKNKPWLLVEGVINEWTYSIGPLFHGKETGCYDCFNRRLLSNDENACYTISYENYLRNERKTSKPGEISSLVKDLIASIIILDISKYIGGLYVPDTWRANLLITVNPFTIARHNFLKAPICSTCKPELDYNSSPWFESVTLK